MELPHAKRRADSTQVENEKATKNTRTADIEIAISNTTPVAGSRPRKSANASSVFAELSPLIKRQVVANTAELSRSDASKVAQSSDREEPPATAPTTGWQHSPLASPQSSSLSQLDETSSKKRKADSESTSSFTKRRRIETESDTIVLDEFISVDGLPHNSILKESSPADPSALPPWTTHYYHPNPWALHDEILDFNEYMALSPEEMNIRKVHLFLIEAYLKHLLSEIDLIVHKVWSNSTIQVFGSYITTLLLPTSDLDLVILDYEGTTPQCLFTLAKAIEASGISSHLEVVSGAKVPLVKFTDKISGIQVDISFGVVNGPANTAIAYRDLNMPYTGGLGSYALVLLVTSFLQQWYKTIAAQKSQRNNLGILLVEFFRFYGKDFNYFTTGISLREGGSFFHKLERSWMDAARPYLLSVEDPQDETNDVGRNAYRILIVKRAFEYAYSRLFEDRSAPSPTLLSRLFAVDHQLLEHRAYLNQVGRTILNSDEQDSRTKGNREGKKKRARRRKHLEVSINS